MNETDSDAHDDNLESLLISFFSNVAWPLIRNLIQELVTLEKIDDWKEKLKNLYVSLTTLKMKNASDIPDIENILNDELYEPGAMPAWITSYIGNILNEFSSDVARALNEGGKHQVEWIARTASVINFFEIVFWRYIHQNFLFNTSLTVNTINSIKEKFKDQLKRYMDQDISLMEAKNAVLSYLVDFNMKNEFILEIIVGIMRIFYELIDNMKIEDVETFITNYVKHVGDHDIHEYALADDETTNIEAVIKWFIDDFLNLCIKSIKVLYPELTNDKINAWKESVEKNLHLLLEDTLSLEDFSKRFLTLIMAPNLEFDIEKGVDENKSEREMMNIENRGSIIHSMLSCAEMIYEEHKKDPLMRDLLASIKKRKTSSDMLYF